jgi:ABC-type antimicrobial peptide transport system permease subunit
VAWWTTVTLAALSAAATVTVAVTYDSVVNHPLPGSRAGEVLALGGLAHGVGMRDPVAWWGQAPSVEHIALYSVGDAELSCPGLTRWMRVAEVSGAFFQIFDRSVVQGRSISRVDEAQQNGAIVVSNDIWRLLVKSDEGEVSTCRLGGRPATIVGVVNSALQFPSGAQVWLPRATTEAARLALVEGAPGLPPIRNRTGWIALPKDGIGVNQVRQDMEALLASANGELSAKTGVRYGDIVTVSRLVVSLTAPIRPGLVALVISAGIALLLCLGNVVVHSMAVFQSRRREIAIQLSLGASRWQPAIAAAGEALLVGFASAGVAGVATIAFLYLARQYLIGFRAYLVLGDHLGPVVALATMAAAALIAFAALSGGLLALQRSSASEISRGTGLNFSAPSTRFVRRLFIALSTAVATALVAGAFVADAALIRLLSLDLGYSASEIVSVKMALQRSTLSGVNYASVRSNIEAIAESKGIHNPVIASGVPIRAEERGFLRLGTADRRIMAATSYVDAGYFSLLQIPVQGPGFSGDPDEVVLNNSAVERLRPGDVSIGSTITFDGIPTPFRVVGIADDTRTVDQGGDVVAEVYRPHPTIDGSVMPTNNVFVQLLGECTNSCRVALEAVIGDLQRIHGLMVLRAQELPDAITEARGKAIVAAKLWTIFGFFALGIAAFAAFSMANQNATRRQKEIGIRIALGASRVQVFKTLSGEVVLAAAGGSGVGALATLLSVSAFQRVAPGIGTPSAPDLALAGLLIMSVAVLTAWGRVHAALRTTPSRLLQAIDSD